VIEEKELGFVGLSCSAVAGKSKEVLISNEYSGRTLRVDEARPPKKRSLGGGGGDYWCNIHG
jgi:hypothetical protein